MRKFRSVAFLSVLFGGMQLATQPASAVDCFVRCTTYSKRPDSNNQISISNGCNVDLTILAATIAGDAGRRLSGHTGISIGAGRSRKLTWPFTAGNHTIRYYLVTRADYGRGNFEAFNRVDQACSR